MGTGGGGTGGMGGSVASIYEHENYQGLAQTLAPGQYDVDALSIGNDTLTSLKVPSGWTVTLFEHAGFSGASKTFIADTPNVGGYWNALALAAGRVEGDEAEDERGD
jgi:hypothetical protein